LNRVRLTDNEFARLREDIITPDVFSASKKLRERQYFEREDDTPLHYTLVNIKDWCKNECEDLTDYINSLDWSQGQNADDLRKGYEVFKVEKYNKELAKIANKHGLKTADLKTFVENIMSRIIFDGEKLTDLLEPLDLGWKDRRVKELALMEDLVPLLKKLSGGREISGLKAYE